MTQLITIAATGTTQGTAAPITATPILVTLSTGPLSVILPSDAIIGSVVEIHVDTSLASNLQVFPPVGETLNATSTTIGGIGVFIISDVYGAFRKISDTVWGLISSQ